MLVACARAPAVPEAASATTEGIVAESDITVVNVEGIEPDPMQAEILADGEVSHAEMERALLAEVACINSRGFEARLEEFTPGEGHGLWADAGTAAAQDELDRVSDECHHKTVSQVAEVYSEQHGPSEQEAQAQHQRFLDCLVGRGYDEATVEDQLLKGKVDSRDSIECGRSADRD